MHKKKIGLLGASSIVAANMMGSGIALLPASLATIGSITIISWCFSICGALCLAFVFSRLGIIDPKEGGPVAYAKELSSILGHQTGILYWFANWIGNLAISITAVEYLSYFYPPLSNPIVGGIVVIISIWVFTVINFYGVEKIAKIVSISLFLLLIPVIGTALFGWPHFSKAQFMDNWNVSNTYNSEAIFAGIVLTIWSFIGVESASVSAGVVKNPKVNVPLATMIGTCLAGFVYIASTTVISGMFPAKEMAASGEPFGMAFGAIAGGWVEPFVAFFIAIACLASLGSWMMLVGQAGMAAAKHGTLPEAFRVVNLRGIPARGIAITSLLMTIVMIALMFQEYFTEGTSTQMFSTIIATAVVVTVIPYFYSCIYLIHRDEHGKYERLRFLITIIAICLCFTAFAGSQKTELVGTFIFSFSCFIFYCMKRRKRGTSRENHTHDTPWR